MKQAMEPKVSLRTPRQPSMMQGFRPPLSRPHTMQSSWSSSTALPTRQPKATSLKNVTKSIRRPHTTSGDARAILRNSELFMEGMTPLRPKSVHDPPILQDNWASSKISRTQTTNLDQRPHTTNSTTREEANLRLISKVSRPHTATSDSRSVLRAMDNLLPYGASSTDPNPTKKLRSVKSYSSPSFSLEGFSPPESHKESIFDARSLKYPKNLQEPILFDGPPKPSRVRKAAHTHHLLDPSLNLRNSSINNDFKVVSDNPMDSLVTQMPLPPPASNESATGSISPSQASRMLRKQIEAALRMYPRNTWGPVTKWGYQEDLPCDGKQNQKDHFISNKDKLEKQRLESRKFGHQRHWVDFKNLTNFWDQNEAPKSTAYAGEKERFLTDSEKMLRKQNDKRIARAKGIDNVFRERKRWREFKRLEKREGEYIDKMEGEQRVREDGKVKANDSGVVYNIVTLEYPNNYAGDLLRFEDAQIRWRQCMRSLRIQSKQSGARLYNVLNWKPHKPCCVPPEKPSAPQAPDPNSAPSPRRPKPPLPRNMLYLEDKCEDVPIGCTNDLRTNW